MQWAYACSFVGWAEIFLAMAHASCNGWTHQQPLKASSEVPGFAHLNNLAATPFLKFKLFICNFGVAPLPLKAGATGHCIAFPASTFPHL
eukprot:1155833-Pelagomonas_calceolata.AAC.1